MKKSKKRIIIIIIIIIAVIIGVIIISTGDENTTPAQKIEISPIRGSISTYVSTTGTVEPKNRVEITPPMAGRVEKILVKEGDKVKAGQVLIWMSSTDRAALMDAARVQGDKQDKYWEEVYKPIPLVAPIAGTIIVRSLEPGQTVTTATPILVISDMLLVTANVDETDVGRIKEGQLTEISLDAYPDISVNGRVTHINYESTTVNNVTTYEIKIMPDNVPAIFKSGMSANIKIYDKMKNNLLLVPHDAITYENGKAFVLLSKGDDRIVKTEIQTGLDDEQNVEILSGITDTDKIISSSIKFIQTDSTNKETGTNPFMPGSPGERRRSSSKDSTSSGGPPAGGPPSGGPPPGGPPPGF